MKTNHPHNHPCGNIGWDRPAVLFGRLIHPADEPVYRCADHTKTLFGAAT